MTLKGLKVAPYYGCLLLRPPEVGLDDPESPTILRDFLETWSKPTSFFKISKRCKTSTSPLYFTSSL